MLEMGNTRIFQIMSEIECSKKEEATSSESGVHLNDILEMLISLDEPGIFMDPVDDSFAPNYSKVIKNPMCFLQMRKKIYAQQYTSWRSFVEDFERICYNAMKYNKKRSEIWNAANTLLHQGKRYLEQQAGGNKTIMGISIKAEDSKDIQEPTFSERLKVEIADDGGPSDGFLSTPMIGVLDEHASVSQTVHVAHEPVEKQELNMQLIKIEPSEISVTVLEDMQLPRTKEQEERSAGYDRANYTASKQGSEKSLIEKCTAEDAMVEVVEPFPVEDIRLIPEDQATERSSSFDGTWNDLASHDMEDDGGEVESQIRDGNGATVPTEDNPQLLRRKKRALDLEWKMYRQGIEWRCRWLELRVKELGAQAIKYDSVLDAARSCKKQCLLQQDGSAVRTNSLFEYTKKNRILQRQNRRKAEDDVDLKSYMTRHPLFSRYEKRRRHDNEDVSTGAANEEIQQMLELEDFNRLEDQEIGQEFGDEYLMEEDSMEQLLWHIEALQMHVGKLKSQLTRGVPVRRYSAKVQMKDVTSSSPQGLGHFSLFGSPRSVYGPAQVPSPGRSGTRPVMSVSKIHMSPLIARRRNSDYDINNVVMPGNVMANYVEPARHAFIETPHWRFLDDAGEPDVERSSDEDTDDEHFRRLHAEMEVKERQQQYAPWSKNRNVAFGKGNSKSGGKGVGKAYGKGIGLSSDGLLSEDNPELTTGFGHVPKRKRQRRESREVTSITKPIEPLYASQLGPLEGCNQDELTVKMIDGLVNSYLNLSKE